MTSLYCIALAVYFEARSQPLIAQELVAHAVLTRVEDTRYPDDACSVVWEAHQFEWTADGKSDTPTDLAAFEIATAAAQSALDSERVTITHFHDNSMAPFWAASYELKYTSGSMLFYYNATPYR